ncbi:MAG: ROK family protein [Planctomycetes bacterium]|nr:ROK family protein [Planctomycetota bacterium]
MATTLAIDIGGTGLKMIALDEAGTPVTERTRVLTPSPPTADAVLAGLTGMLGSHGEYDRVSVGFPGVIEAGVVKTAANLDPSWIGVDVVAALSERTGKPTRAANDADIQGWGVINGKGVELVLTLGTGLGSAIFVDGELVPNLELGHHPFEKGDTYEERLGKVALKAAGKKKWLRRVKRAITQLESTFNYTTLHLGGGNAKKVEGDLPENVQIGLNVAGLLGGIALWRKP